VERVARLFEWQPSLPQAKSSRADPVMSHRRIWPHEQGGHVNAKRAGRFARVGARGAAVECANQLLRYWIACQRAKYPS